MSTSANTYLFTTGNWIALTAVTAAVLTWFLAGFRPVAKAWIDGQGQRIRVKVRNFGRAEGLIESVTFVTEDAEGREVAQEYTWFRQGDFSETLGSFGTIQFIAQSMEPTFHDGTLVRVTTKGRCRHANLIRLGSNESWELDDVLPKPNPEERERFYDEQKDKQRGVH